MARIHAMTDADRQRVSDAVGLAEGNTAGEIVTILAERSDDYADAALVWSATAAMLALTALAIAPGFYLGLWDWLTGNWASVWSPRALFEVAAVVAMLKFIGVWLILLYRPLRVWMVPRSIRHARVRARAVMCFKVGAERRTQGRTGILIYLSLAERRAEIVADAAIAAKVTPEVWGEALAAMLSALKDGRMADGIVAAVERVGAVLAEHFPRAGDDINELPDRLIEV
ncbi:MAG: TPM domain-containing protein [Novosphingobium sp.]